MPLEPSIEELLRRCRRRLWIHHGLRWGLEVVAGVILALALAAVLLLVAPLQPIRLALLLGGVGMTIVLVLRSLVLPLLPTRNPERLALLIEGRVPPLRNWVLSSRQLSRELAVPERRRLFSAELAEAHLTEARRRAAQADLLPLTPARPLRRRALFAAALALALGCGLLISPEGLGGSLTLLWTGERGLPTRTEDESSAPLVGDIHLRLVFPAHSGLPAQELAGSDGSLRGVKGTTVTLRARPLQEARRAFLLVEAGPTQEIGALLDTDGSLSAVLTLQQEGVYRFGLVDAGGRTQLEQRPRPITVLLDQPPAVQLLEPATDLELHDLGEVKLSYRASDDYGLARLELAYQLVEEAEPRRRALPSPTGPRETTGEQVLLVDELGIAPGDQLELWLEATDNDTVDGPKVGRSARRRLTVLSAQQRHDAATAELRQVWEAMVRLLGTRLELTLPERAEAWPGTKPGITALLAEQEALLQAAGESLAALRQDPLAATDVHLVLEGFHARTRQLLAQEQERLAAIERGVTRGHVGPQLLRDLALLNGRGVGELERTILALDKLLDRQQVDDLRELTRQLQQAQAKLRELLRKYQETQDPALRKEIEREMARLRAQVEGVLRRLAAGMKKLPFEHVNADALKGKSVQSKALEFESQLQKMQQRFAQGDVQGALDELERFASSLDGMVAAMDEDARAQEKDGMTGVRQEMNAILEELEDVERAERRLEEETRQQEQEQDRRQRAAVQDRLDEVLGRLLRRLDDVERSLQETPVAALPDGSLDAFKQSRRSTDQLRSSLLAPDLEQALEVSQALRTTLLETQEALGVYLAVRQALEDQVRRAAGKLAQAGAAAEDIEQELRQLLEQARRQPPAGDRQQLERLARRQQELSERTRRAQERLEGLEGGATLQAGKLAEGLGEAGKEMDAAQAELGRGQPRTARPAQRRAADQLRQVGEKMARGARPGRMGQQGEQEGEGAQGRRPSLEQVRIPGAAEHESPREFREALLEAMKQGAPDAYREQIRGYYRELVK
ncbi:MAG: DUF4175 family protein [Myxococcota bacterium]|nr:DUF4175 family protein [Myxococcota bacterium]